jgi:hypothetical protein
VTKAQFRKKIDAEIKRLTQSSYGSKAQALTHIAVREQLGLDDDDALAACQIGIHSDSGIAAFWVDESGRRVVLAVALSASRSSPPSKKSKTGPAEVVRSFVRASASRTPAATQDETVAGAMTDLGRLRSVEPDYPITCYVVTLAAFPKVARKEAEVQSAHLDGIELVPLGEDELKRLFEEHESRDATPLREVVDLELKEHFLFEQTPGSPKTLVAVVNGKRLAELVNQFRYRLFQRNVRYYLRGQARYNKAIARQLKTGTGREEFWYFNNGIAIVCDQLALNDSTAQLTNMQIVNGAQTTATLGEHLAELQDDSSPAYVLVRVVESADEDLQYRITLYNNQQTAVKDRDLQSNDPNQDRLQVEFDALDPPWFYERKRGEWNARVADDEALLERYGKGAQARRIDNEQAAQAAYAFYFDPAKARARKTLLFRGQSDDGYYEELFNSDTTARWLLLPYRLSEHVVEQKRKYMKQIRDINPKRASAAQNKQLRREWLKFADQFVLGAMGFYITQRVTINESILKKLLSDVETVASHLYPLAVRDLGFHFDRMRREYRSREEPLVAANYVKQYWADARLDLEAEWEARIAEGEDPLAGIPALTKS